MNCIHVRTLLRTSPRTEWLPKELAGIEQHVRSCAECALLLESEQRFEAELRSLFEPEAPKTILPIVIARTASLPRYHAKAPTRKVQTLSTASKTIGIACALGAYLFGLIQGGLPQYAASQSNTWIRDLWGAALSDAGALIFAAGLLLYVIGLFAPLTSTTRRSSSNALG